MYEQKEYTCTDKIVLILLLTCLQHGGLFYLRYCCNIRTGLVANRGYLSLDNRQVCEVFFISTLLIIMLVVRDL